MQIKSEWVNLDMLIRITIFPQIHILLLYFSPDLGNVPAVIQNTPPMRRYTHKGLRRPNLFKMNTAAQYAGNSTRPPMNRFKYLLPANDVIDSDKP